MSQAMLLSMVLWSQQLPPLPQPSTVFPIVIAHGTRATNDVDNAIHSCTNSRKWLAACSDETCTLVVHQIGIDSDSFICKREEFQGLTCFQIAHHPLIGWLWSCNQACKGEIEAEVGDTQKKRKPYAR